MKSTINVPYTSCPVCGRRYLVADVTTDTDTGASTAVVRCAGCGATGKTAATWRFSLANWQKAIADAKAAELAKAKAKAKAKTKPGTLSEKNLKIRMKRIDRYVKLVIPELIAAETGDLKDERVQRNLAIRSFNIARKLAAKRADVHKQVKAGELV